MKSFPCLAIGFLLGCQGGDRAAPAPVESPPATAATTAAAGSATAAGSAYAKDIEALCEVVTRSGADDTDARTLTIANWLAANLTTPESRTFLVKIQPLDGVAKAEALEAEARRVGLSGCELAGEWRTPTP